MRSFDVDAWPMKECVMSTAALTNRPPPFDRWGGPGQLLAAWETRGQIYSRDLAADLDPDPKHVARRGPKLAAPGTRKDRKHPRLAVNGKGEWLLVWTEGTAWQKVASALSRCRSSRATSAVAARSAAAMVEPPKA